MTNQPIALLTLGACLSPAFAAAAKNKPQTATQERPNVILIYGDDMGKGMLSAYGQPWLKTPNMDRIINNGVQFTRAYGCHYSAPARAALLTGYSDCHKGHWHLERGEKGSSNYSVADTTLIAPIEAVLNARDVRLPKDNEYLPEVFKKAGYYTGQIGKLEYGFLSSRQQVASHGWDYFYGFLDHGRCHGFFPPFLFENDQIVMIEGNTLVNCGDAGYEYDTEENYRQRLDMTGKAQYSQFLFNDKINDFINEHKDERFFLYHPTQLPHGAVCTPYIHEDVKYMPNLTPIEKEYATMVLLFDEAVGKILDELDELGLADKTMIVLSVDNGHEIYTVSDGRTTDDKILKTGEKIDNSTHRFTSENVGDIFNGNMGMTGRKRSNLEGGVCVPLAYYYPGVLEPHSCDDVVANYDMIATMAEMLNVKINKDKDAASYYDLLTDASAERDGEHYVVVDSREGPSLIMNNGWKLRYDNVTDKYQLFNIKEDRTEENDMASQDPERVAAMREILISKVETTECRGGYSR